jgi:hypothetical protein
MTFCIIAGFLLITCFPIWPHFLKASRRTELDDDDYDDDDGSGGGGGDDDNDDDGG